MVKQTKNRNKPMRKITAEQFDAFVEADRAWATKLTEPVEITGFCDMTQSNITHLSPLLHFTGRNEWGSTASFFKCKSLKVAEGTFDGWVNFSESGIEKIGNLSITQPCDEGAAASFQQCKSLKIAEGTFPGFVDFGWSGIETIGDLCITKYDNDGEYPPNYLPVRATGRGFSFSHSPKRRNRGNH